MLLYLRLQKTHVIVGDPAKDLLRLEIDEFYKDFTGTAYISQIRFCKGKIKGEKVFNRFQTFITAEPYLFDICQHIDGIRIVSSLFNKIIMDDIAIPNKRYVGFSLIILQL